MAAPRAMRRLLRVLELEEEQCRALMEAAVADLKQLENALTAAGDRERKGRRLVAASVTTGALADRVAGLEESRLAQMHHLTLKPSIAEAEVIAGSRRQEFLGKRAERRQVETVVEKARADEARDAGRRSQRALDDWFLRRER